MKSPPVENTPPHGIHHLSEDTPQGKTTPPWETFLPPMEILWDSTSMLDPPSQRTSPLHGRTPPGEIPQAPNRHPPNGSPPKRDPPAWETPNPPMNTAWETTPFVRPPIRDPHGAPCGRPPPT